MADTPTGKRIDLDARRAARAEKRGDTQPDVVAVGGDTYELPVELPVGVIDAFGRASSGDLSGFTDGVKALVGDEAFGELMARHHLSMEDLEVILTAAMETYGVRLGESSASTGS